MQYIVQKAFVIIFVLSASMLSHAYGLENDGNTFVAIDDKIESYIIPKDHPAKRKLDRIFSSNRVLTNMKTFRAAGFEVLALMKYTKTIVAKHPDFPDYIFKLYLDAQIWSKDMPVGEYLALRPQGARLIQQEIKANGWENYFKVPVKWIYVLPEEPLPLPDFYPKNFILIEDDMNLLSESESTALWKSDAITHDFLIAYYSLVKKLGLCDSFKISNVPFSKDGRVAFVDTQMFHQKVSMSKFTHFLSSRNQTFWKELVRQSGSQTVK